MAISIDLESQVAFVAGGSSGIGLGIARRFEAAGAMVHVNLNGVMHLCTRFRDHLKRDPQRASSIVLVGSTSSFIATPGQPAYGASKGALVTLTRSLAQAWARR